MARLPRLVVPGYPHHVTQRGNRRMKTFFSSADYRAYLDLIGEVKQEIGVVRVKPLLDRVDDWVSYLSTSTDVAGAELLEIRKHSRTGRPVGCESFIAILESLTKRRLKKRNPGPKPLIK